MAKSPSALRTSLSKAAARAASGATGSPVGPSQNIVVRTQTASFESADEFRANPVLEHGTVFECIDRLWKYDSTLTNADDGVNYLRPTAIASNQPGRAKALSTGATSFGPFTSIAEFRAATPPSVLTDYVIDGVGTCVYRPADGAGVPDNGVTIFKPTSVAAASPGRGYLLAASIDSSASSGLMSAPCIFKGDARGGVTVSSGLVDSLLDQSGFGSNATQTSDARPAFDANGWSDGGPCITFDGTADWLAIDGILPHIQAAQSKGLSILFRSGSVASGGKCLFGAGGAGNTLLAIQGDTTNLNVFNRPSEGTNVSENAAIGIATTRDQLLVLSHVDGAGNTKAWFEGKEYVFTGDLFQNTYLWTHAAIGCSLTGGVTPALFFNGKIRAFELYSGALTAADYVAACERLLGRRYVNLVFDGNSLTASQGATGGFTYPAAAATALGTARGAFSPAANLGVGGQTTPQMTADFAAQVAPLVRPQATNVLIAWELTNDIIINGDTYSVSTNDTIWANEVAAAAVANYWTYCDTARAAGYIVIGATGTDRTSFSAKMRAATVAANALIVAQQASHLDGLVRPELAAQLATPGNTTYFGDGIHFTNAGYGIMAQLVANEVQRVLAARGL